MKSTRSLIVFNEKLKTLLNGVIKFKIFIEVFDKSPKSNQKKNRFLAKGIKQFFDMTKVVVLSINIFLVI